jgi:2-polyprenyl-3-methyl-5-hydroxy-6-metoxy-1,4-benzoquinol methylase
MLNIIRALKRPFHRAGAAYIRLVCASEYAAQKFAGANERSIEFAFLFRQLVDAWPVTVLDVGTGMTALPHLVRNCGFVVTAVDNIADYWTAGMTNRHYHVINDDITRSELTQTFDVIACISVLEHIKKHRDAMKGMFRLLNPGGRLILTCPYNERAYSPNVYDMPGSGVTEKFPFVTQAYSRRELETWLSDSPFEVLEQEYWDFFEGDYWTCGRRLQHPKRVGKADRHQITCISLRKPKSDSARTGEQNL